ncbi:MAG: hypothetical protein IPK33_16415 [Gemmatimonadetes bacterium]|nr:hypothetical protein [Gemmatimonadota bacterium]
MSTGTPCPGDGVVGAGSSGGTLSEATSTSDVAGLARVTITPGGEPRGLTVRATSGTLPAATFSVTAI